MTAVLPPPADVQVAVTTARSERIGAHGLTELITELRLSLRELDKVVYPGKHRRFDWDVVGLHHTSRALRWTLSPNQRAATRPPETLALPGAALVSGVAELRRVPEIPQAFNEQLVSRVQVLGDIIGADVNHLDLSRPGRSQVGVVDSATVTNAGSAVRPVTAAFGSITGRLDTLTTRRAFRAQIYKQGRGITLFPAEDRDLEQDLKDLFGREVDAWGMLRRNERGQAVGMVVYEVRPRERPAPVRAADLLGIDPGYTGGLTTDQFVTEVRGGR